MEMPGWQKTTICWESREILPTHFEHHSTRYFNFIQDNKFIIQNCLTDLE